MNQSNIQESDTPVEEEVTDTAQVLTLMWPYGSPPKKPRPDWVVASSRCFGAATRWTTRRASTLRVAPQSVRALWTHRQHCAVHELFYITSMIWVRAFVWCAGLWFRVAGLLFVGRQSQGHQNHENMSIFLGFTGRDWSIVERRKIQFRKV